MEIIKYETEIERQQIVDNMSNNGYSLVEIQNVTTGNFLGFVLSSEIPEPKEPVLSVDDRLLAIENKLSELNDLLRADESEV